MSPKRRSLLLRLERLFDLLLDTLVVLREELLFVRGQDSERHADRALLELHVQPVLAVCDSARNLEIETAETGAVVGDVNKVVRQRSGAQLRKEQDGARTACARRKVIDGIP